MSVSQTIAPATRVPLRVTFFATIELPQTFWSRDGRITSGMGAVPAKSTVPVIVPPAETGTTLYGCVAGAITDGRGGTPSSSVPLRGCAEAVSSRAHDNVAARIIEKPSNRRGIYLDLK
jgi:hypothetical protein